MPGLDLTRLFMRLTAPIWIMAGEIRVMLWTISYKGSLLEGFIKITNNPWPVPESDLKRS